MALPDVISDQMVEARKLAGQYADPWIKPALIGEIATAWRRWELRTSQSRPHDQKTA